VFGEAIGSFCETLQRPEHGLSNELCARRRTSDATLPLGKRPSVVSGVQPLLVVVMCILFCLLKVGRLGPSVLFQSLDRLETFNRSTHISLGRSIPGLFSFPISLTSSLTLYFAFSRLHKPYFLFIPSWLPVCSLVLILIWICPLSDILRATCTTTTSAAPLP
jgi:hypothetical protein